MRKKSWKLTKATSDEIKKLMVKENLSVPELAVIECKLHPQTVYSALRCDGVDKLTFDQLMEAKDRLSNKSAKVAS